MVRRCRPFAAVAAAVSVMVLHGAQSTAPGAVKLDNVTFDKITAMPGLSWLVKFDKAYAHGEKEDHFKELCRLGHRVPNFFIAEVPVTEYGDKDNDDLRERYEIASDTFPAYLLFKGSNQPVARFEGFKDPFAKKPASWNEEKRGAWSAPMITDATAENLAKWLHITGVKFPAVGTIFELDVIAKRFASDGAKEEDLAEARRLAESDYRGDPKAVVYVKILEKIQTQGGMYVAKETERVEKLLAGPLSPEKATQMKDKLQILKVFPQSPASAKGG